MSVSHELHMIVKDNGMAGMSELYDIKETYVGWDENGVAYHSTAYVLFDPKTLEVRMGSLDVRVADTEMVNYRAVTVAESDMYEDWKETRNENA